MCFIFFNSLYVNCLNLNEFPKGSALFVSFVTFVAVTVHLKISQTLCTDVNDNVCVFMIHRDKKNGKWKDLLNGLKLFVPHFELFFIHRCQFNISATSLHVYLNYLWLGAFNKNFIFIFYFYPLKMITVLWKFNKKYIVFPYKTISQCMNYIYDVLCM